MWNVTPTTNWIIVFGGGERGFTDTRVIQLSKPMHAVDSINVYEIIIVQYGNFENFASTLCYFKSF